MSNNVRLTKQAHTLLSEKAKNLDVPMKEIASKAIFLMFSKEKAQEDCREVIEEAKAGVLEEATLTIRRLKKIRRARTVFFVAFGFTVGVAFFAGIRFALGVI